ncbi:MAG: hypothetical protein NTW83_07385 [Cyanobacteria bacterium]|nr:hypothetical protein [Cyanobacteriota bacterium]
MRFTFFLPLNTASVRKLFPHPAVGRGLHSAPWLGGRVPRGHPPGQFLPTSGRGSQAQCGQGLSEIR